MFTEKAKHVSRNYKIKIKHTSILKIGMGADILSKILAIYLYYMIFNRKDIKSATVFNGCFLFVLLNRTDHTAAASSEMYVIAEIPRTPHTTVSSLSHNKCRTFTFFRHDMKGVTLILGP